MALETGNSLYWKTKIDNTGIRKGTKEGKGLLKNFASQVTGMDIFAGIALSASIAFKKVASHAHDFAQDLEQAMLEVQTISQYVTDDYIGASEKIVEMSTRVPDSATMLAKAYYQIVSAGYDGAEGMKILEASSRGAVAGVTDTITAADGLTTVMNAWKLSSEEVTRVADIMFRTVEKGKTTFPEIASSINLAASLAASMNIPFEQIAGGLATLTKQGVPTAMAMTQIRSSIISMSECLGDGWSKVMTYQEGLGKIRELAGGSETRLREMVGRIEAMNAVLGMTGGNAIMAASDLEEMKNASGSAEAAFIKMAESGVNQVKIFKNQINQILKNFGDKINETVKNVSNNQWIQDNLEIAADKSIPFYAKLGSALLPFVDAYDLAPKIVEQMNVARKEAEKIMEAFVEKNGESKELMEELIQKEVKYLETRMASNREFYKEYDNFSNRKKREYKDQFEAMDQEQTTMMLLLTMYQEKLDEIEKAKQKVVVDKDGGGKPAPKAPSMAEALEYEAKMLEKAAKKVQAEIRESMKGVRNYLMEENQEVIEALDQQFDEETEEFNQWLQYREEFHRNMLFNYTTAHQAMLIQIEDLEADYQKHGLAKDQAFYNAKKQIIGQYVMEVGSQVMMVAKAFQQLYKTLSEDTSELTDNILGILDGVIAAIEGYYSGNTGQMLSGILGAFDSLAATLDQWLNAEDYEFQENYQKWLNETQMSIEGQNRALQRQLQLVKEIAGIQVFKEWSTALQLIDRELSSIEQAMENFNIYQKATQAGTSDMSGLGPRSDWTIEDYARVLNDTAYTIQGREALQELVDKYYELIEAQKQLQEEINESLTQTTTDSIADSIVNGFAQGKYAAQDFADDFETMMKNAILESIKKQIIEDQVAAFYEKFVDMAASGGRIDLREVETLREEWDAMIEGMQNLWDALTPGNTDSWFGTEGTPEDNLRGAIKGITEETAGILTGQMNAIRMNVAEGLDVSKQKMALLQEIVNNTAYNKLLASIDSKLDQSLIPYFRADGS